MLGYEDVAPALNQVIFARRGGENGDIDWDMVERWVMVAWGWRKKCLGDAEHSTILQNFKRIGLSESWHLLCLRI